MKINLITAIGKQNNLELSVSHYQFCKYGEFINYVNLLTIIIKKVRYFMLEYIQSFCHEFQYPEEATNTLTDTFTTLKNTPDAYSTFINYIDLYNKDQLDDFKDVFTNLDVAADIAMIHKFTLHLLFFICLSKHTRELYDRNNISYEIYFDSMSDLKWKLYECYQMHDVWGNFVAWWEVDFFRLKRFALGRLQFETIEYDGTYSKNGYEVQPGDIVLNMHIPSMGPLHQEDCFASYQKAVEFYKEYFVDKPTTFVCYSWLLYPKHKEFLPEGSNILKFMDNFDIISSEIDDSKSDLWRLFYKEWDKNPENLPSNSSLLLAYKNWLVQRNPVGSGHGVFFFDGENII
jgi:hypothetical protein